MSMSKKEGYDFWRNDLKSAKYVVAPMVDQSELPWRMLSRKYDSQLCYTPMFHAGLFVKDPIYRKEMFTTCSQDRPLIVQFCANDPEVFVQAAQMVESQCDGVDLNLGCPQTIAKRGHYGAFLQDEWDLVSKIVSLAHERLSVPITCKIRVFENEKRTVEYAQMLEKAGCQLLTVHGRTRDQKGSNTGLADWEIIKTVKNSVSIPVFANGNIQYFKDVDACLKNTGVDGIMTAEGNLHNPALFSDKQPMVWEMAHEYLEFVDQYPCQLSAVRGHLFKLLHHSLCKHTDLRMKLGDSKSLEEVKQITKDITDRVKRDAETNTDPVVDFTGLPHWVCQPYIRPSKKENTGTSTQENTTNKSNEETKELSETQIRRKIRKEQKLLRRKNKAPAAWSICPECNTNPQSIKCGSKLCRFCCKEKSANNNLDCVTHRLWFNSKSKKRKLEEGDLSDDEKTQDITIAMAT